MARPILYPYRIHSQGARALAEALDTIMVYPDGKYVPRNNHVIVCWGAGAFPNWWNRVPRGTPIVNNPREIGTAINKLRSFEKLSGLGVSCPPWTNNRVKALEWQAADKVVVARQNLTSSEGRGIVVADKSVKLPNCHLYTVHVRHRHEYRVHVWKGKVIDIAQKRRRNGADRKKGLDSLIRNWGNGWIFAHEDVECPAAVTKEALKAVEALSLDFGAVDVGYREKNGKAYVFEVNTAPGIEGQTVGRYAAAIRELCR